MRFRESIELDRAIDLRRESLSRNSYDNFETEKRVLALAVLINARNELDEIAATQETPDVVEHVKFVGTDADGRKIRPRRQRRLRQQHAV